MTIFLLVISFIIDGVLLIGLFIMNTRIRKTEELELRQKEIAHDIEGLFQSYLLEIKEENAKLANMANEPRTDSLEAAPLKETKKESYVPPVPEEEAPLYEPSLTSRILELKRKGYTIEEIARQLNRGKTEIELLLKFQQKS
ncbi:coupling factor for flagellin transcription and translation [Halobacillus fulvus]|nr:coupling factor for flagellin transcription and translation [Halobacillus fulvus]